MVVKDEEELLERIKKDPDVMTGKPVIKGTRLTIEFVIKLMGGGATRDEIIEEYDDLTKEDIQACLVYASKSLNHTNVEPLKTEKRITLTEKRWKELHSMKEVDQTYDDLLEMLIKEHNRLKLIKKAREIREMDEEELVEVDLDDCVKETSEKTFEEIVQPLREKAEESDLKKEDIEKMIMEAREEVWEG